MAKKKAKSASKSDGDKELVLMGKDYYTKIEVDTWLTRAHTATLGDRQHAQYRAQSRQFSVNMEIQGEIEYWENSAEELKKPVAERNNGEKMESKDVFAMNMSFWDEDLEDSHIAKLANNYESKYDPKKIKPLLKRLVIKSFSEITEHQDKKMKGGNWKGSIEETQLLTLNMTFGEKRPRPFFFVSIPKYDIRVPLMRTFTYVGDRYIFSIPNPKTNELTTFALKGKRATPGDDFECILAETGQHVATLDDKKINLAGKVVIKFDNPEEFEELYHSRALQTVLILFSTALKWNNPINDRYEKIYKLLKNKKKYANKISDARKSGDAAKLEAAKTEFANDLKQLKVLDSLLITNNELTLHKNPRRTTK